jgi:hypothetical protein
MTHRGTIPGDIGQIPGGPSHRAALAPVADNSTPEGKEKNRRVEVWLRK